MYAGTKLSSNPLLLDSLSKAAMVIELPAYGQWGIAHRQHSASLSHDDDQPWLDTLAKSYYHMTL
jgi:hypothetical protein